MSTLAASTVSPAHHSPLRHGRSSLLTWFVSLLLAPAADLLSPQLDQIQETVFRAGSLDGVKSLSPLLSATKVGRWQVGEKTLQVDFLSGDASCQKGKALRHKQGMGRICRTAYSHFWWFWNYSGSEHIARLSYRHTAKARRNDGMGKIPSSAFHCCLQNSRITSPLKWHKSKFQEVLSLRKFLFAMLPAWGAWDFILPCEICDNEHSLPVFKLKARCWSILPK